MRLRFWRPVVDVSRVVDATSSPANADLRGAVVCLLKGSVWTEEGYHNDYWVVDVKGAHGYADRVAIGSAMSKHWAVSYLAEAVINRYVKHLKRHDAMQHLIDRELARRGDPK